MRKLNIILLIIIVLLLIFAGALVIRQNIEKKYTYAVILMDNTKLSKEEVQEKLQTIDGIKKIKYISRNIGDIVPSWAKLVEVGITGDEVVEAYIIKVVDNNAYEKAKKEIYNRDIVMQVFLANEATEEEIQQAGLQIGGIEQVKKTEYICREDALREMKERLEGIEESIEGIADDIFSDSYLVYVPMLEAEIVKNAISTLDKVKSISGNIEIKRSFDKMLEEAIIEVYRGRI